MCKCNYKEKWNELKSFIEENIESYANYNGKALRDAAVQCEVQCRAILREMQRIEGSKNE